MICPLLEKFLTSFDMNRKFLRVGSLVVINRVQVVESRKVKPSKLQLRSQSTTATAIDF